VKPFAVILIAQETHECSQEIVLGALVQPKAKGPKLEGKGREWGIGILAEGAASPSLTS